MRNVRGLIGLLVLASLAHASAAYGATASASTNDPPAGSPAGAVYELPFEKGRGDAAPSGSGGTSAGTPGGTRNGGEGGEGTAEGGAGEAGNESTAGTDEASMYRSENNFGSSSQVPGDPSAGGGSNKSGSGGVGGNESQGGGGGGGSEAGGTSAAHVVDSGNTSPAANIALLSAIGLVAVGLGVVVSRANRLRTPQ